MILKLIFIEYHTRLRIGFIWFRLLESICDESKGKYNFGIHKGRGFHNRASDCFFKSSIELANIGRPAHILHMPLCEVLILL
jgi:hypothetical protein